MPYFVYKALSRDGNLVSEEGEYSSLEDLYYNLQREGALLVDYKIKRGLLISRRKIKRKEVAEFLHQLALMIKGGIPITTALEDLDQDVKNPSLKIKIKRMRRDLLAGSTFSEAAKNSALFSPLVLSLIQIGEESGTLDKTLEEASQHLFRIDEIISQTKRALTYPIFVLIAMTGALAFWLFYVLPKILQLFQELNIPLPLPTILLIKVVNFLQKIKLYILPTLILTFILLSILYKNKKTQVPLEKILLRVPILGRIKRLNFLAFFFEHFALLLSSGIHLLRIFRLLRESFHRLFYQRLIGRLEEDILRGERISTAMKKEKLFSALDARMVAVGENTGKLEEQMRMLAGFYYQEVKNLVDSLTKILEPVVLAIAGFIFLLIIIALIGPIYELVSKIGKL